MPAGIAALRDNFLAIAGQEELRVERDRRLRKAPERDEDTLPPLSAEPNENLFWRCRPKAPQDFNRIARR
jgi:hypothetical protein